MLSGSRDKKREAADLDKQNSVLVKLITLRRWILVLAKTVHTYLLRNCVLLARQKRDRTLTSGSVPFKKCCLP